MDPIWRKTMKRLMAEQGTNATDLSRRVGKGLKNDRLVHDLLTKTTNPRIDTLEAVEIGRAHV